MVSSIFEVDVVQGLERLASVVASPQDFEVAGELRAQAEIFAGFAELLRLPEFGAIAETVQHALNAHPEQALEITKLALVDFEQSRQAIMAGNRTQGIGPSVVLVELANPAGITPPLPSSRPLMESVDKGETAIDAIEMAIPQLENIFGSPAFEIETIQLFSDSDVSVVSEFDSSHLRDRHEMESMDAPETLEAAVQSIEKIFGNLPPLQNGAASPVQAESPNPTPSQAGSLVPSENNLSRALQVSPSTDLYHAAEEQFTQELTYVRQIETPAAPSLTVRVDADRLERMNNLVGELAINRDGLSLQNEQLQGALRALLNRFTRFQDRVNQLRELSDQMLVAPERYGYATTGTAFEQNGIAGLQKSLTSRSLPTTYPSTFSLPAAAEFDPLEMDSYNALHSQLQEILEDMVPLEEIVDDISLFTKQSNQTLEQQRHMLSRLRDELIWARMLPLGEILSRFPRVLRDLSTAYHKPTDLKLTGTGVLVEKAILEKLYDPLLHLLRNAFDHGIEPPQIRRQRGKPEKGQIEIRAYHKGNQTVIEVNDDGQGLNLERIRNRALELGWLSVEQLAETSPAQLCELIFEPGFSTALQVNELSGRGVGLDVVRSQLRSIKGTVSVKFSPGKGTTFTLHLPLTLTIAKLIVCLAGSAALALPTDGVEEILTPLSGNIRQSGSQRFLLWREQIIPVYRLANLVDYHCPLPEVSSSKSFAAVSTPKSWALPMLVLRGEQQIFALEVDRLITEQELVIKPFSSTITPPSYTYGCSILGDGSLIPVIDGIALLNQKLHQSMAAIADESKPLPVIQGEISPDRPIPPAIKAAQTPTILVVDDSATLRRTLVLSLKRAGFRVLQAQDGREAINQLQQNTSVQLIICDIEMPNMNGFEFLTYRRQDSQLSKIPVVMLTSRSNEKHRWLATQLNAAAYFTKPYLEQEFLAKLKKIIQIGHS
ncbi:hybrid sensor histidine kinase/response regulator [Kovacikia minuta CCNUW1]|uniref:hybrid sensor histidine kinase/response regulator n=1 Tax=Kovacikia minuta TaxID=2931930 RepID=UPI001CCEB330|nr:hybrid sensor histidine kinase/response regulator [Kovacikia minuta]UBF24708.1 hybrid sensor histidine kinase/response regulator [Kovacikia minuta CCNUW1]